MPCCSCSRFPSWHMLQWNIITPMNESLSNSMQNTSQPPSSHYYLNLSSSGATPICWCILSFLFIHFSMITHPSIFISDIHLIGILSFVSSIVSTMKSMVILTHSAIVAPLYFIKLALHLSIYPLKLLFFNLKPLDSKIPFQSFNLKF